MKLNFKAGDRITDEIETLVIESVYAFSDNPKCHPDEKDWYTLSFVGDGFAEGHAETLNKKYSLLGTGSTTVPANLGIGLIEKLKTLSGAINYDGDASTQVVFLLTNGETLRFVVGEDSPYLSVDQYRGLPFASGKTDLGLPAEQ